VTFHILIVEDNLAVQQALCDTLQDFQIHAVDNIGDAVEYLQSNTPDLALVDLWLGNEDGMTLARFIRENNPYVAVVILTGHGSMKSAISALDSDVQAYLLKPVHPHKLKETIHEQIELMQANKQRDVLADNMRQAITSVRAHENVTINSTTHQITKGDLFLDRERYEVKFNQQEIIFSPI